jgi:biopolymer transport protein ExbD
MIRTTRTDQAKQISGINITPFTDVCLVLLIIFMVTAPALLKRDLTKGFREQLPTALNTAVLPTAPLVLRIEAGPKLFLNQQPVTFDTLGVAIAAQPKDADGSLKLLIRADEHLPYAIVIKAMDIAGKAGVSDSLLATRAPEQQSSASVMP